MQYQIDISPEAELDLNEAVDWYEAKKQGLGFEFALRLEEALSIIENTPQGFAMIYRELRHYPLKQFPYSIFYRISETKQQIQILAIVNQSRGEGFWQRRIS